MFCRDADFISEIIWQPQWVDGIGASEANIQKKNE